jgi:LysR family transcriptional regulator, positive regulator for ilvC
MDIRDFEAFERVCQTLHFQHAARELGMSPSALTRRIQRLEQELGRALFQRDQRSVEITPAGELFRDFVRGELARLADVRAQILTDEGSPSGELRIACTVTACHSVLPRLLAACRELYPNIRVRLSTQDAARSLDELERGEVDLAVVPTDPSEPNGFSTRVLDHTDLVFVGPLEKNGSCGFGLDAGPPPLVEELARIPVVMPLSGIERRRLEAFFRARSTIPNVVAEVRGNEGVLAMVSLGSGISLVPRLVLEQSALLRRVMQLSRWPAPEGYDVSLCAKSKILRRTVVRAFWEIERTDLQLGVT